MEGNVNGTTLALDRWKSADNPGNGQVNRANRKSKGITEEPLLGIWKTDLT